jgi:hypothetical protein
MAEVQRRVAQRYRLVLVEAFGSPLKRFHAFMLDPLPQQPDSVERQMPRRRIVTGAATYEGTWDGKGAATPIGGEAPAHEFDFTYDTLSGVLTAHLPRRAAMLRIIDVSPEGRMSGRWHALGGAVQVLQTPWGRFFELPAGYFCAWPAPLTAPPADTVPSAPRRRAPAGYAPPANATGSVPQ